MTNIDFIGGRKNITLPEGTFILGDEEIVKAEDLICFVSIRKEAETSFMKPSSDEIGRPARYAGQIVVRKYGTFYPDFDL